MTVSRKSAATLSLSIAIGLAPMRVALAQSEESDAPPSSSGESSGEEKSSGTEAAAPASGATEESKEGKETEDAAASEEGKRKLSDRIKSVQRKAFLKKSRIEVFPHFALDLNDPFFQHLIVGGAVGFHIVDSLSLEARGGAVFASLKQNAIRFVRQNADSLLENAPEFKYHADLDLLWAPLYGKISLFSEAILHFDTYVTAGPGIFGTDGGVNPAVNIGLGQRYFLTDWLVARIELRNYVFVDSRNEESDLQNLLILGFAVSGFFPTTFEYEFQ